MMSLVRSSLVRVARPCATALVVALLAAFASAQLVLPRPPSQAPRPSAPPEPRGNVAPYHTCTVCQTRNYNAPTTSRVLANGNIVAWCMNCKRDTEQTGKHAIVGLTGATDPSAPAVPGALAIPPERPLVQPPVQKNAPASPTATSAAAVPGVTGAAAAGPAGTGLAPEAAAIFARLHESKAVGGAAAEGAVRELAALGDAGVIASREFLMSTEPACVVAAGRVLLRSGNAAEIERVKRRIEDKLPGSAGGLLVDELVDVDPVQASPAYLAGLLENSQAAVRASAQKALRKNLGPDLLPVLASALSSKRADARAAAVDLVSDIPGPEATGILLDHLADPTAKVATGVMAALVRRDESDLDARLLGLAFRQRWILRANSYALIALIEREDLRLTPVIDATYVEPLLGGLSSTDPFVAGSCAAALAGIGYRTRQGENDAWLDREVPDRLVLTVSGKEFHNDFTALAGPALRRLRLISGQDFSTNGPAWVQWWVDSRGKFSARRVYITYAPEDVPRLEVRYRIEGARERTVALFGPALASSAPSYAGEREAVVLTEREARDLVNVLEREDLFGPEHLPGARGERGPGARSLEIAIAGRSKSFSVGRDLEEPWFERAVGAVMSLRERNRWQFYVQRPTDLESRRAWSEQSNWWSADHSDLERALRLKVLVLAWLARHSPGLRDPGLAELSALYEQSNVAEPADADTLQRLLQDERAHGERVQRLVRLILASQGRGVPQGTAVANAETASALSSDGTPGAPVASGAPVTSGAADPTPRTAILRFAVAAKLVGTLSEAFGESAREEIALVLQAGGGEFELAMARHDRPLVRALAGEALAARLATSGDEAMRPRAQEAVMKLLDDPELSVESAAALALGAQKVEAARTELLVRARLGRKPVRIAALKAIGLLGGEFVFDALMLGLTDADQDIRIAAATGMSTSDEPAAVGVLISLLGEGPDGPAYDAARAGLAHAGQRAVVELERALNGTSPVQRREAALCLSEMCAPAAASVLMSVLSTSRGDARVQSELAILTGIDFRGEIDPAAAWWDWWDGVVHDDALAWFCAALERVGLALPPLETFGGEGTRESRIFLFTVMSRAEQHLVERATRELGRMMQRELGPLPPPGAKREAWLAKARASLEAKREQ